MKSLYYYIYIQELFEKHLNKLFTTPLFKVYIYKLVQNDEIMYIGSTSADYSLRYSQHIHEAYENKASNSKLYNYFRNQIDKTDFTMEIIISLDVYCYLQQYLLEDFYIISYDATNKLNSKLNNKYIYQLITSDKSYKKKLIQEYLTNQIKEFIHKKQKYMPRSFSYVKLNKSFYELPLSYEKSDWCKCDRKVYPTSCIYNIKLTRNPIVESSQISDIVDTIYGIYLIMIDGDKYYGIAKGGFNNLSNYDLVDKINKSNNVTIMPVEYYYDCSLTEYPTFFNRIKEISSCDINNIIYDNVIIDTFNLKRPKLLFVDIPPNAKVITKRLFVKT